MIKTSLMYVIINLILTKLPKLMKKILLFNFTDKFLLKISRELSKKFDVFLSGNIEENLDYSKSYNTYISDKKFRFSNISKLNKSNVILTNEYLSKFIELENTFYRLIDRVAITPLTTIQKRNFYLEILKYWKFFFEKNKIEKVIYESHPHTYFEIVPFFLAKHLQINTYIMKLTSIPNYTVLDTNLHQSGGYINLEDRFDENYNYIKNILSSGLTYGKDKRAKNLNEIKHVDPLNRPLKYFSSRIFSIFKLYAIIKKKNNLAYNLNFFEFVIELIKRDYQKTVLRRYIKKNSKNPDLEKKFIYFALHYQPERSTDPQSGYYSDQLIALSILNNVIPEDYIIYVKEHPRQLNDNFPDIRKKHFRNIKFYQEILKLSKVRLVDLHFPSEKLIEKTKLNCSCTGTNIWEGLYKYKKPGLSFGHSWLSSCLSTPSVLEKNENEIKEIIVSLLNKTVDEINNNYEDFLKHISKYGIITSNVEPYEYLVSEENMVKNTVDVIEGLNVIK